MLCGIVGVTLEEAGMQPGVCRCLLSFGAAQVCRVALFCDRCTACRSCTWKVHGVGVHCVGGCSVRTWVDGAGGEGALTSQAPGGHDMP